MPFNTHTFYLSLSLSLTFLQKWFKTHDNEFDCVILNLLREDKITNAYSVQKNRLLNAQVCSAAHAHLLQFTFKIGIFAFSLSSSQTFDMTRKSLKFIPIAQIFIFKWFISHSQNVRGEMKICCFICG